MTELSDFNLHFVSLYSSRAFLVAGRFYDLAPDRWEKLACIWYARNGFFELKNDRYLTDIMLRFKSVDALVAEEYPEMTPTSQQLYDQWIGIKAKLAKQRSDDPIKISQPKPTPTPLPIPDKIPEPEPKETKPKKKLNIKLLVAILGAVAFCLKFTPVPAVVLGGIDIVIRVLQSISE
jgi:hypothetical protein